jgi:hypothetical protein
VPFENGQPTPDEIVAQKQFDDYLAREKAMTPAQKVEEFADQTAMRQSNGVWAALTIAALLVLGIIAKACS